MKQRKIRRWNGDDTEEYFCRTIFSDYLLSNFRKYFCKLVPTSSKLQWCFGTFLESTNNYFCKTSSILLQHITRISSDIIRNYSEDGSKLMRRYFRRWLGVDERILGELFGGCVEVAEVLMRQSLVRRFCDVMREVLERLTEGVWGGCAGGATRELEMVLLQDWRTTHLVDGATITTILL